MEKTDFMLKGQRETIRFNAFSVNVKLSRCLHVFILGNFLKCLSCVCFLLIPDVNTKKGLFR